VRPPPSASRCARRASSATLSMLTIALARIEFDGRHGATAVERRTTRKFEVDVELEVEVAAAEASDRLDDTVDYSRVA
jgi:dihydroneopterin aldolase